MVVIDANTGVQQHYLPMAFASKNKDRLKLARGVSLEPESTVVLPVLQPPPPQPLGLTSEYPFEAPIEDRREAWERKAASSSAGGTAPAGAPQGSSSSPGAAEVDDDEDKGLVMRPRVGCVGGLCGPRVASGRPPQERDEELVQGYWRRQDAAKKHEDSDAAGAGTSGSHGQPQGEEIAAGRRAADSA